MKNSPKTPDQITEQIGKILNRKPQVFGWNSDDVNTLTHGRATTIITKGYLKNRAINEQLHSDYLSAMEQLQFEHNQLLTRNEALEYIASHDILTELPNRKELDRRIRQYITTEDKEVVFMIFDLRKFKYINDTYGHEVGDRVLVFIAGVCKEICKLYKGSLIARKGGDEFTGMFPGCSQDDILGISNNFQRILGEHWKNRPSDLHMIQEPVGVAMGIISLQDNNIVDVNIKQKGNITPTLLEEKVSKALYKADKMSEAAKHVSIGVLTEWKDDYNKEVVLSPENKELLNQLNGIIRHWISDESVDANVRAIRELIAPTLETSSILEELERISACLLRLNLTASISTEFMGAIQRQVDVIRTQVNG